MTRFNSITELISTLYRERALLSEMFGKRKALAYRYDHALDFVDNNEDRLLLLEDKMVIRRNGNYLEIDGQVLDFFEQILEVNEEINTSYIHENIALIKENINYHLQETNEARKYDYLRIVKSNLRKLERITMRNIVDLNRNIDNTFKTEPNYKIKIAKLENHKKKLDAIKLLVFQIERLLTEDEQTFFKSALDEELKNIQTQLFLSITNARHNLIETQKQIVEFINQVKYQSEFIEKLRQVKYLKDQFELKGKTNFTQLLKENRALPLEPRPIFKSRLSLDAMHHDDVYEIILKVSKRQKTGSKPMLEVAGNISDDYLNVEEENEIFLNLDQLKNGFMASGNHLFDFILAYDFPREVPFNERVTVFCQMISLHGKDFDVTTDYNQHQSIEYAVVYPKTVL